MNFLIGRLTKDQEVTDIWSVSELLNAYINVFFVAVWSPKIFLHSNLSLTMRLKNEKKLHTYFSLGYPPLFGVWLPDYGEINNLWKFIQTDFKFILNFQKAVIILPCLSAEVRNLKRQASCFSPTANGLCHAKRYIKAKLATVKSLWAACFVSQWLENMIL